VNRTAVVTGGSGFLGKKVADKLREKGYRVHQMALPQEDVDGEQFFKGDITDPKKFEFPEADTIVHCAGILESSHPTDELMFKVNYEGTKNVFNEGSNKGMRKFIFISTVAALGPQGTTDRGMTEDITPDPKDAYGRSKLKAELFLKEMGQKRGIDITVLRPTVLYGEGMNLHSSGMKTFTAINNGIMPLVSGGKTIYNMLHVENFIHAIMLSIEKSKGFNIYNVSEGPYTHEHVVNTIEKEMGKKGHKKMPKVILYILARTFQLLSPFIKGPPKISMTKYRGLTSSIWHLGSSKIEHELGYEPVISLEEGVKRTVDFYGWKKGSDKEEGK
jgi:nucleoside-diphosphate-sugar epimerase